MPVSRRKRRRFRYPECVMKIALPFLQQREKADERANDTRRTFVRCRPRVLVVLSHSTAVVFRPFARVISIGGRSHFYHRVSGRRENGTRSRGGPNFRFAPRHTCQ